MQQSPEYMRAFKPFENLGSQDSEWDSWSALYQPDGGSVNMEKSYTTFYNYVKANNIAIYDNTTITKFSKNKNSEF